MSKQNLNKFMNLIYSFLAVINKRTRGNDFDWLIWYATIIKSNIFTKSITKHFWDLLDFSRQFLVIRRMFEFNYSEKKRHIPIYNQNKYLIDFIVFFTAITILLKETVSCVH